ncbi:NADH dehydrogenase, FAD-containing subunit [Amycolatopsis marina]|uniref:NADH dehydrogenase, FAD-containing subunit n=1 Tax=Amycolatopsis marina TaxID=490629 RepID=A0A1I1CDI9_9PSEU|nr:FAD-dependent oxidoreductase [Amycolatopsis marina]SFB60152.1 NADH dehydrogenase, FAD-containing subunit [Amycolatopsis marina]
MTHVVVLGAGYAGLTTALRLGRGQRVTIVDTAADFTERIRLHEYVAGRPSVSIPLTEFTKGRDIATVRDTVTAIDPERRTVHTGGGREITYDILVYALGSRTDTRTPGVAEHAFTVENASELRERVRAGAGSVAVVGGGLTGIEMAAELAEAYPGRGVELVTADAPGDRLSVKGKEYLRAALERLGVTVRPGVRVSHVDEGMLRTDKGDITAEVIVWAASFAVSALAAEAGLDVDDRGRIRVDDTLRSLSHPDVYAVGDAAAVHVPGVGELRMSCASGMPVGAHAADAITARAAGREPAQLNFRYFIQCVSLGRRAGLIQAVRADDSPKEWVLRGRAGAFVKEQICRSTVSSLRLLRRTRHGYWWPKRRTRSAVPSAPTGSSSTSSR